MPFTFSHPAIILPLTYLPKRWVSLTGLVIGSMTPDFEYFLRMRIKSNYSHTIDGLFWFDLPLGLLLAFIFHNIVRNTLFDNLPVFFKSRFIVFKEFNWNEYFKQNWLVVLISILTGASSHLFWDSFTHEHGYFVQIIPVLSNTIELFNNKIIILKILQHSSTLLGSIVILYTIYQIPPNNITVTNTIKEYWLVAIIITLIILAIRILTGLNLMQYGNVIVTSISSVLISLIITPLLIRKKNNATTI